MTRPAPDFRSRLSAFARRPAVSYVGAAVVLCAVTLAVFGQTVAFQWLNWDDDVNVTRNPWLNPVTWSQLRRFWVEPYNTMYTPVAYMVFALQTVIGRYLAGLGSSDAPSPALFHSVSLMLHLASVLLVWRLLCKLVGRPWPAAAGAMLFAIHPLQVESVAWITEQRCLVAALFSLLAITFYLSFAEREGITWTRALYYIAALAMFILAVLGKPTVVTVPLILGMLDYAYLGRPPQRVAIALAPWLLPVYFIAHRATLFQSDKIIKFITPYSLRPFVAGDAVAFYTGKLLLPIRLAFGYGRTPQVALGQAWTYVATILVVAALSAVMLWPRLRACRVPVGIFLAGLLPVLGFIPFAYQNRCTMADRYVYLALLGPALGVALAAARWNWKWVLPACVVCFSALGVISFQQCRAWHDTLSLMDHEISVNPDSAVAYGNRANALLDDYPGRTDEAIAAYYEALRLDPRNPEFHYNLGVAFQREAKYDQSETQIRIALLLKHDFPEAYYSLADLLQRAGHIEEAINDYRAALAYRPEYPAALNNLGNLLRTEKQPLSAIECYQKALQLKPDLAEAHFNWGIALLDLSRFREAADHFAAAVAVKPDYAEAHFYLGVTLFQLGRLRESADQFRAVLAIAPDRADARQHLNFIEAKLNGHP